MVAPEVGDVVVLKFPFSDLSASRRRPALVLAAAGNDDWICLQITSKPYADAHAIKLDEADFSTGSLQRVSYVRPGKLFTAHGTLFENVVGRIRPATMDRIRSVMVELVQSGRTPENAP